jgi:hypothetical protein
LDFPDTLPLLPAIGLFHVHGHQELCYARYAPTFIRGIGKADGEILETNWSVLNGISPMTRTMMLAHRVEVMDAHIGDNNWKKMISMGECQKYRARMTGIIFTICNPEGALCNKWKKICKTHLENTEDFELMNETASAEQIESWTRVADDVDHRRFTDISVMDIYNINLPKGVLCKCLYLFIIEAAAQVIPRRDVEARLMELELYSDKGTGITSWLISGLKIQESQ